MGARRIRSGVVSIDAAALLGVGLAGCSTSSTTDAFYFQPNGLQTERQGGTDVDLIVGLRYAENEPVEQILEPSGG